MRTAILAALLLVVFAACGGTHATIVAPQATPAPVVPGGDSPPGFRLPSDTYPLAYTIALAVDPSQEGFAGTETIKVRLDTPRQAVWLHGRGLEVSSATIAGKTAVYEQLNDDGLARLALDAPVGPGDVDVEISWQAKYSDSLESVYRVRAEGLWYVFTQFEPTSARDGIPCFDEPGFKAPFTLTFTTRKGDRVVANSPDGTTDRPPRWPRAVGLQRDEAAAGVSARVRGRPARRHRRKDAAPERLAQGTVAAARRLDQGQVAAAEEVARRRRAVPAVARKLLRHRVPLRQARHRRGARLRRRRHGERRARHLP